MSFFKFPFNSLMRPKFLFLALFCCYAVAFMPTIDFIFETWISLNTHSIHMWDLNFFCLFFVPLWDMSFFCLIGIHSFKKKFIFETWILFSFSLFMYEIWISFPYSILIHIWDTTILFPHIWACLRQIEIFQNKFRYVTYFLTQFSSCFDKSGQDHTHFTSESWIFLTISQ